MARRNKVQPLLLMPEQVEAVRLARAAATPYKLLMRQYGCSRETLSRAARAAGPYRGVAPDAAARMQALIDDAARWRAHILTRSPE